MVDITDLYSTVSRTRVSPQKSYVASYSITSSYADTGATLSVANGQYYCVILNVTNGIASQTTFNGLLLQGATTMQTLTVAIPASSNMYIISQIFQNTSGSTQTVKLQAKSASTNQTALDIQLISGSFIVSIPNGSVNFPTNAYITNLEMVGAILPNEPYTRVGVLNLIQDAPTTTSSLTTGVNIVVSGINCTAIGLVSSSIVVNSFAAFDFDGKTLAL